MGEEEFDKRKEEYLSRLGKPDKSKKGSVDEEIWPLLNRINALKDYFTTSSCAGRINFFLEPSTGKKWDAEWLFVTHQLIPFEELEERFLKEFQKNIPENTVWFRVEGGIIHVECRTPEAANQLLITLHEAGWKHSGIITLNKRIIVEATTPYRMDVPISNKKELLVTNDYLRFIFREGIKKLSKSRELIKRLEEKIVN